MAFANDGTLSAPVQRFGPPLEDHWPASASPRGASLAEGRGLLAQLIASRRPQLPPSGPDSSNKAHAPDKIITYIRHGKSAGNAGMKGCVEMGSLTAYRDGTLVAKGEQQVIERVASMDPALVERIVCAQVVLVSPLARAMATAVIVLAQAHRRSFESGGRTKTSWPRVEVVAGLREKVKSRSERPGSGEDPLAYVRAIAEKYGQAAYGHNAALQSVAEDICRSYDRERAATHGWAREPDDALSYHEMIQRFKDHLRTREETNLLLVGHSGWARFAFSAVLPAAHEEHVDRLRLNLITGARDISALGNAGVLVARFSSEEGRFQDVQMQRGNPAAAGKLPNTEEDDCLGILSSAHEARAAGVVPQDGEFDRILLLKLSEYTATWEVRLFTFSASGGQAHLAWATRWGEHKDSIAIGGSSARLTRVMDDTFIVTEVDGHRPFKVRGRTVEDAVHFVELFTQYRRRCSVSDVKSR